MNKAEPSEAVMVQSPQDSFGAMVQRAIDKGVPVETMERLLAMYEKLQARQAKAAFDAALASFQGECPTIAKTTKVLNKDGVDAGMEPGFIRATCRVTHQLGHSEASSFAVPIDRDAFMNPAQKVASALTFAKRYAFCNGFGILTGDEDDDSRASHAEPAEQKAQPKTPAAKPTPKAATEKTRDWFLPQLCVEFELSDIENWARHRGYLEAGVGLDQWPLAKVPTTRELVAKLKADLAEFIKAKQPTDKLTPQGQLKAFCTAAGFSFEEWLAWAVGSGNLEEDASYIDFDAVPAEVAARIYKSAKAMLKGLQAGRAAAEHPEDNPPE